MKNDENVKKYFEDTAQDFDGIYENRGDRSKKFINKVFRKGMRERFKLTLEECEADKIILDIGCGSGRFSLPIAEKGAKVIGIDYSSRMIELANKYLRYYEARTKTKLNVEFVCCDFLKDFNSNELFDITVVMGVFDYLKYPMPFLEKVKSLTKDKIIASYPAKFTFQAPIRKIWLWTKNCPVYFYTERKIVSMNRSIGLTNYEIMKIPAGYFVKTYLNERP